MVKVGLWGYGGIATIHRRGYANLEKEGYPVKLVAVCDIRQEAFDKEVAINITDPDAEKLPKLEKTYTNIDDMLANEDLDMIDICLPGYMHKDAVIKALSLGYNVLSEKPMALYPEDTKEMLEAAKKAKGRLTIGQCLRYNPEYHFVKELIENKKYGKVVNASFSRLSSTPIWGWENWYMDINKSGGVSYDLHIHDIDLINFFFGLPKQVTCLTTGVERFSGRDSVFTSFLYEDGKVITARADWMLPKTYQFEAKFMINFENATIVAEKNGGLTLYTDEKTETCDVKQKEHNIQAEIRHFVHCIENDIDNELATIESTADTILLESLMTESAKNNGKPVTVK